MYDLLSGMGWVFGTFSLFCKGCSLGSSGTGGQKSAMAAGVSQGQIPLRI